MRLQDPCLFYFIIFFESSMFYVWKWGLTIKFWRIKIILQYINIYVFVSVCMYYMWLFENDLMILVIFIYFLYVSSTLSCNQPAPFVLLIPLKSSHYCIIASAPWNASHSNGSLLIPELLYLFKINLSILIWKTVMYKLEKIMKYMSFWVGDTSSK